MSSRAQAAIVGGILLIVSLAAALSVDVVKTGFGLKGDEATYVTMGLSAAFDHDLTYQRRDLERFFGLYRSGPEGIFLKRGKQMRLRVDDHAPFVHITKRQDLVPDRLYFGKALLYGIAAAPFVRLFGLNGFFVFHVLLLFAAATCFYAFLAARSNPGAALLFTTAFVGATCVPVYVAFVTPEILHFALVAIAYFLWLYKEVASEGPRMLRGPATDLAAAALLGAVIYSKPPQHALLIVPLVLTAWLQRRYLHGFAVGAVCVVVAAGLFVVTAANAGEFNYQGGDRKTFYSKFPFDGSSGDVWTAAREMSTNDSDAENIFQDFTHRLLINVKYFLVGRHFGFVPYFFPGVIAVGWWLLSTERRRPWRLLTFLAVIGSALGMIVLAPFSWSGGGGPPGNRYFMSVYAAVFFLMPPIASAVPGMLAWSVGALFTAKMVMNPFVAAKFPNQTTERGFARRLPVELTMANDLPVMLLGARAHAWVNDVLMYFLDEHSYPPERVDEEGHQGIWIAADGRADILIRSEWPIDHLTVTAESPVRTTVTASMGAAESRVELQPGKPSTFDVRASGVRGLNSYAYLLSAQSSDGFVPHLQNPASDDYRNLGALIQFRAVPVSDQR